ncbi:MAG TPA: thiamine pyrophosphate-binding protein, partial [Streptosporangiaceae bacterium]|nr:thiamine pyrophosphate-binding protein [Streptosporangiaceae bacterium]
MKVSEAVADVLTGFGADTVFGLVGSGNFHVTNALIARGARFIAARHECGATSMADGWARMTGRPALVSLHQGPGYTNALTAITEAAKSRTPMVVLAADVGALAKQSNFRIEMDAITRGVGAVSARLHSAGFAVDDTIRAYQLAAAERRTVVLALPLDVQAAECEGTAGRPMTAAMPTWARSTARAPDEASVTRLAQAISRSERPVFIAGRGARIAGARPALEQLADRCGGLLATSAAAKGLFTGNAWNLDVSGGFASPLAAELITGADLVVGWGCSLNMWTLRHGALISPGTVVAQVDLERQAIGAHRPVHIGVTGDVTLTAEAVAQALGEGGNQLGYRSVELRDRLASEVSWRNVPYDDESNETRIDPRTLSIALDDLLPTERIVAIDSGNFIGYPAMFMSVPDVDGFCFTQSFQSVGLGLASAIGSAIARPDRLVVAALGDGGALMGISELETAVRLRLPMVIVVYDDEAYGAEVHHFGPEGYPLDTVKFPPVDIAQIARGFGCAAARVRQRGDLGPVAEWLDGPRDRPLLIDAKVTANHGSWWLEEAFR